jgi:hypothetical protein
MPKSPARAASGGHRKLIAFDDETWMALDVLARDRMSTIQELADEAFADLLKKHHRPVHLRAALKQSATAAPSEPSRSAPARQKPRRARRA